MRWKRFRATKMQRWMPCLPWGKQRKEVPTRSMTPPRTISFLCLKSCTRLFRRNLEGNDGRLRMRFSMWIHWLVMRWGLNQSFSSLVECNCEDFHSTCVSVACSSNGFGGFVFILERFTRRKKFFTCFFFLSTNSAYNFWLWIYIQLRASAYNIFQVLTSLNSDFCWSNEKWTPTSITHLDFLFSLLQTQYVSRTGLVRGLSRPVFSSLLFPTLFRLRPLLDLRRTSSLQMSSRWKNQPGRATS